MTAVFIAYNQAHEDDVLTAMRELDIKGFTGWPSLVGAGQRGGEPRDAVQPDPHAYEQQRDSRDAGN